MNPTIEVQITAKLDRLDAALKVAEAKIGLSAVTMGKTGDEAGSMFVDKLVGNIVKGLAMGAITNVLGGGILTALQGINAGKGGKQIGLDIASGIVNGAKSIPVVGIIVSIFDELVNGFDRIVDAQFKSMLAKAQAFSDAIAAKMTSTVAAAQSIENKIKIMEVKDDPKKLAEVNKQIQIQTADDRLQAIQDEKQTAIRAYLEVQKAKKESIDKEEANVSMTGAGLRGMGFQGMTSFEGSAEEAKAKIDKETKRGLKALNTTNVEEKEIAKLKIAIAKDTEDQIAKIDKEANDKAAAANDKAAEDQKALDKKTAMSAMEMGNQMVADFKEQEKEKYDAAMKAQQDIIDANTAAQAQISKVGRLDKMANEAARNMIESGQTALGQFNFAQSGAGGTAMAIAQKQLTSIEKIEAATAEQVRLTKESAGFR